VHPKSKDTEILWSDIAGRILINAISYPIEYAKVLIQVKTCLLVNRILTH